MDSILLIHEFREECNVPDGAPVPTGTMTKTATVEGRDQDYANASLGSQYTAFVLPECCWY